MAAAALDVLPFAIAIPSTSSRTPDRAPRRGGTPSRPFGMQSEQAEALVEPLLCVRQRSRDAKCRGARPESSAEPRAPATDGPGRVRNRRQDHGAERRAEETERSSGVSFPRGRHDAAPIPRLQREQGHFDRDGCSFWPSRRAQGQLDSTNSRASAVEPSWRTSTDRGRGRPAGASRWSTTTVRCRTGGNRRAARACPSPYRVE